MPKKFTKVWGESENYRGQIRASIELAIKDMESGIEPKSEEAKKSYAMHLRLRKRE